MHLLNFNPPVVAHRGASKYAPENTLSAFTRAAQIGVQWVEFDVMLAACETPVIFHDETLDRTTNLCGVVSDYPFNVLVTLDAGAWFHPNFSGQRIPSLEEIKTFLSDTGLSANIELKPEPGKERMLARNVLRILQDFLLINPTRILFSSFSIEALRELRKLSPECLIGLLLDEWREDWLVLSQELNAVTIHTNYEIVTPELAATIKQADKQLLCYTVNDPILAAELFDWGVDAVFSDVPDIIISSISEKNREAKA